MTCRPDPLPDGWVVCMLPMDGGRSRVLPHEATTELWWASGLQCTTCLRAADDDHDREVADQFRNIALGFRGEVFERDAEADGDHEWLAAYRAAKAALSDLSDGAG